jgi:hypothetical protein
MDPSRIGPEDRLPASKDGRNAPFRLEIAPSATLLAMTDSVEAQGFPSL